jgi:CubicO group peptidase (beta-lactamase class C family)
MLRHDERDEMSATIQGSVATGFETARDEFAANFAREGDYQEVGASFAAFHKGRCVVDLWGGHLDAARGKVWERDSLANVWSATKGIVAICVALCVERGHFKYEDTVARVWPDFAAAGKADITIAQLLSHQAGLNGFTAPTTLKDWENWDLCCRRLAAQAPAWPPGTASSYHAMTFGWLAGELVRRATGKSVGLFLSSEVAKPLDADMFIGLPQSLEPRVAQMMAPKRLIDIAQVPLPDVAKLAVTNPTLSPDVQRTRAWRAAEIPGGNGQATAYGLARIYAAVIGGEILRPETVAKLTAPQTKGRTDMFLGMTDNWAMGMCLNTPGIYGANPRAFGFSGWGGSFGCADPDAQVSIGYVCNQMGPDLVGDPRTMGLCKTVLESAGRA